LKEALNLITQGPCEFSLLLLLLKFDLLKPSINPSLNQSLKQPMSSPWVLGLHLLPSALTFIASTSIPTASESKVSSFSLIATEVNTSSITSHPAFAIRLAAGLADYEADIGSS
jgi:hypothetical protein